MKLKDLRRQKGFKTALDLARTIGCAKANISRWENGQGKPSVRHFVNLKVVLGPEVEQCFSDREEPQ